MEITIANDKVDEKELFNLYNTWAAEKISPKTLPVAFNEFKKQLRKSTTFIAKENKEIIGFLICKIKKSSEDTTMYHLKKGEIYAELDSIYIKKNHRQKGIGSSLVRACKEELKKHGNPKIIVLGDSISPHRLINFYEKNCFKTLFVSMIYEDL
ncbi:MAG: GNAT family N-acetyltransferase [Candidatus Nanoarchaeia archaeon]|jgi:ribosomal protein S18 acetylase RimI-like enzyme